MFCTFIENIISVGL